MTAFTFDAKEALQEARNRRTHPNRPNRPNREEDEGAGLGGLGRLGTVSASDPENAPATPHPDHAFYQARVAALADPDGIARTPEAIEAVWDSAAALAGKSPNERNDQ